MDYLNSNLKDTDAAVYDLLKREQKRQDEKLLLNAAISYTPKSILEIQGSIFDNIDAEGYIPEYTKRQNIEELENIEKQVELYSKYKDDRFNKCCEYANVVEALAQKRLAKVYENEHTKGKEIFVNVQAATGAIANYIVYKALLNKGDTILSLGVNDGGHTTHGDIEHESSSEYKIINYHISMEKCDIDYDQIGEYLSRYKPKLIIAGTSAFPLNINWLRIRDLINKYSKDTLFMADIAHTAGLVAGGAFANPVGIADVTTLVTYKTFCGPRAAAIITTDKQISEKIDETVFPKIMGSPLLLGIAGMAIAGKIALTDEFKQMQKNIVNNSRIMADELKKHDITVTYGTSDTHVVLVDCNEIEKGRKIADILEDCNILVNACLVPSKDGYHEGIRIGTTCITQLGFFEEKVRKVATIIAEILNSIKNKDEINYEIEKKKVRELI